MSNCTVYIDEAGDLGIQRGTQWFVLSAVVVDKEDEKPIRAAMNQIKTKINVQEIHFRKIGDFYKRGYITKELSQFPFTYMNVLVDTNQLKNLPGLTPIIIYNYCCRYLLERVSWFLRDTNRSGDIVLSARGTSRDNELITYIQDKLLNYRENQIAKGVFEKITAKQAASWDMLQLADVCATTMFLTYEKNGWGFRTPCFSRILKPHLYSHSGHIDKYGIKFYTNEMKPLSDEMKQSYLCEQKERTPGTTTT